MHWVHGSVGGGWVGGEGGTSTENVASSSRQATSTPLDVGPQVSVDGSMRFAFTTSGAVIPSKTYYKFFNQAVKTGHKEHATWANEQYLKSIERAIERRKQQLERINSEIDAGTYQGKQSRHDIDSIQFQSKPTMPFYYMTLAKMHLLNGDVEGATRAFNDVPDFEHEYRRRDDGGGFERYSENVEEACLSSITQWVQELYDDFSGKEKGRTFG